MSDTYGGYVSRNTPPEDQVLRVCPDCGKEYRIAKQFADDPEEVCEPCWDAFVGMTNEELEGG